MSFSLIFSVRSIYLMYNFILRVNYLYACFCCVSFQSLPSRSVFRCYETVIPKGWKHVAVFQINLQNTFSNVVTSHGLIAKFRFLTRVDISFSVSTSHQLFSVLSSKILSKWGGSKISRASSLYQSVWLGA